MKRLLAWICVAGWLVGGVPSHASEVVARLVVDGVVYQDVRWGPVNDGKIVFFHSRGIITGMPLEKLPEEYQRRFGHTPQSNVTLTAPRASGDANSAFARWQRQQDQRQRDAELAPRRAADVHRGKYAVIDGQVVPTAGLTPLVGFLQARAEAASGEEKIHGYLFNLARLRNPERPIPANMRLRPGLWEMTGEQVFLRGFKTDEMIGALLELRGKEIEPILEHRAFIIGVPPTVQQVPGLP